VVQHDTARPPSLMVMGFLKTTHKPGGSLNEIYDFLIYYTFDPNDVTQAFPVNEPNYEAIKFKLIKL